MIGQTISHYKITAKLGAGGMGEVYLAEDIDLRRKVALKFLPEDQTTDPEVTARFRHEAQAAAALSHPNIATLYEVSAHESRPYIVMEHVDGPTLSKYCETEEPSLDEILDLAIQIGEGLKDAHGEGIVHRDLKPANILIDRHCRPKILDFGLAKLRGATKVTKTGSTLGTAAYMSPEQGAGQEVDHRADIWSLGVILYEMVTGRLPFDAEHEVAVTYAIASEEPEPLARYKAGTPNELQRIVSKCLSKNREERYQSAADLVADLRALRRLNPTATARVAQPSRRRSRLLAALAIVGVAVAAVAAAILTGLFRSDEEAVAPERKMLVVLPFENLGGYEDEGFADGLTDAITSCVAKISGLGVISRTSAMTYKASEKTLGQIGAELGVGYVLEGTVLWDKTGDTDRVRIIPQLIQVSDDCHIWSENYERALTQIFAVQGDIATSVAENLHITLLPQERNALANRPTSNIEAYQAYLAGRRYYDGDSLQEAMFERAVALDSNFALAYAALSRCHAHRYHFGDRREIRLQRAKASADRALDLQPDLPEAHLALGYYHYFGHREYEAALAEFAIAGRGLPNHPEILAAEAYISRRLGRFEEAAENLAEAFRLDPSDAQILTELIYTHLLLRNYQEAMRLVDLSISVNLNEANAYGLKCQLYVLQGDLSRARATLSQAPQVRWSDLVLLNVYERNYQAALDSLAPRRGEYWASPFGFTTADLQVGLVRWTMGDSAGAHAAFDSARVFLESHQAEFGDYIGYPSALGLAYAGLGRREEAIREGQRDLAQHPISKDAIVGAYMNWNLFLIYLITGEYDAAIEALDLLLSVPFDIVSTASLRIDPAVDCLRDHPRFQALLEKHDEAET